MTNVAVMTLKPSRMVDEPLVTLALGLTVIVRPDEGQVSVYCPELDIITAAKTEDKALADLADMIEGYAQIYARDWEKRYRFSRFASQRPFIQSVRACRTTKEIRHLFNVIHPEAKAN